MDKIITTERVDPFLKSGKGKTEPDWDVLYRLIMKEYGEEYAGRNLLEAKFKWYLSQNDGLRIARTLNDKMEKYGSDTTDVEEDFKLNTMAFLLWQVINDATELKRITGWMEGVVRRGNNPANDYYYTDYWPGYIDTYANLLYKIGEKNEAIKWQEMAVAKSRELGKLQLELLEKNLEKMKTGEPTWPIEKAK